MSLVLGFFGFTTSTKNRVAEVWSVEVSGRGGCDASYLHLIRWGGSRHRLQWASRGG